MNMKQFTPLFILFLFCLLFAGCSKKEEQGDSWQGIQRGMEDLSAITDRTEYYDITVDSKQFVSDGSAGTFLGVQFFQGEPVELRMKALPDENNHYRNCLCIYRMDGSREVMITNLSLDTSSRFHCYLALDGTFYSWVNSYTVSPPGQKEKIINTTLTKYLPSGEIQFAKEWRYEERIFDIRQLPDERVYLLLEDSNTQKDKLLELDTDTGETAEIAEYTSGISTHILGESVGSLAFYKSSVYDERDFIKFDPEDGSESFLLSLNGTSYRFPAGLTLSDFQVLDNCNVEILWTDEKSTGILERLSMNKIEQIPVILRGNVFTGWLLDQVNLFNQSNEHYHIIPEPCGADNDLDDFARLTSIQLSAGKGPDILYGDFMHDYLMGMISKGVLEDLSPFIESSGIRKEDYFSLVFNNWRDGDKIYGISAQMPSLVGYKTSETLIGNLAAPDGEAIIDALLSNKENCVYLWRRDSQDLLNLFLSGSDTLWGMVDWEKGSCSFDGELFQKLLEAAKQYGDDGKTRQDSYPTEEIDFTNIFKFDSQADLEQSGMIQTGILFDDGCHAAIPSSKTLAVNANSVAKEGAWEFISFLLSQEVQSQLDYLPPIQKSAFDLWIKKERSKVAGGKVHGYTVNYIEPNGSITTISKEYTEADITDEKVEEYKKALEEARPYPIRTIPILKIIQEESAYYFSGSKSAKEVGRVITNRVQLYLDESR